MPEVEICQYERDGLCYHPDVNGQWVCMGYFACDEYEEIEREKMVT